MGIRTINHPDVQINEIDRSQVAPAIVGTNALVMGYASKGEAYNPVELVSVTDLETNFGQPTNEAEKYFYYTCKDVINEGGNLIAAKLPYSNNMDANYKYIGLTLSGVTSADGFGYSTITNVHSGLSAAVNTLSSYTSLSGGTYTAITQTVSTMLDATYDGIVAGSATTLSSLYDFVVVNENKAKLAGTNSNEGLFVTFVDPFDGMLVQRVIQGGDTDPMSLITGLSGSTFVSNLTATFAGSSISENYMGYFPTIEFTNNGADIDTYSMKYLAVVVSKTVADENYEGKLNIIPVESFVGSLVSTAKDPSNGQSVYLGDIINANSQYIKFYATGKTAPAHFTTSKFVYVDESAIQLLNFSAADSASNIVGSTMANDIDKVFEKVANILEYQIDVVVDGGLSTISQFTSTSGTFDPLANTQTITSASNVEQWRNIADKLINFCQNIRKDCMAIIDVPRNSVIEGDQKYIRKTAPTNTFSNKIAPVLKYLTGLNSSYAAMYSDWFRMVDSFSGKSFWLPPSAKVCGIYIRNDRVGNIWDAPAGLNRGIITGINDIAFNPRDKEADQLYMKSFNYAKQYPLDGFVLEGQKTTQVKPSAFDRVNVRRLFLRLERYVYQASRYFVYEPNNIFTRRRLVDTIEPLFQSVKAQGGLTDYKIICDENNNTAEVIDHNELRIAIMLKPTRTAEFLIVDFIATRTDANFDELV